MKANTFIILISLIYITQCEKISFENYSLYKVFPQNEEHNNLLQDLTSDIRFDFWNDPGGESVLVLSSPQNRESLENILDKNGMRFEITLPNIQDNIDNEPIQTYTRRSTRTMQWDAYYNLDDIYAWIDDLAETYPDLVSIIIGGQSYEGRQIKGLKISHESNENRRIVFLEGGIHAREWISPATVNYIAHQLLTSSDEETMTYAKEFDWYIFPVTNPDGYVWTFTENRLWRKSRRPLNGTNFGVDLNRNWDHFHLVHGASTNEAAVTYAGPYPFSEPETKSLSEYILGIGDRIDMYLSFHSFSQMLLIPFGNTTEPVANYHDALNIGRRAMGALSVRYGTQYVTGNIGETIYLASGGSVDWVKDRIEVPLVYCYELRDRGVYGFLLPISQIQPNNEEAMDSVMDLIHQAKRFGYMNSNTEQDNGGDGSGGEDNGGDGSGGEGSGGEGSGGEGSGGEGSGGEGSGDEGSGGEGSGGEGSGGEGSGGEGSGGEGSGDEGSGGEGSGGEGSGDEGSGGEGSGGEGSGDEGSGGEGSGGEGSGGEGSGGEGSGGEGSGGEGSGGEGNGGEVNTEPNEQGNGDGDNGGNSLGVTTFLMVLCWVRFFF